MRLHIERVKLPNRMLDIARFMARTISLDPSYISHSEIQLGLSPDGHEWASDLESRLIAEVNSTGSGTWIYVALSTDNAIVAATRVSIHSDNGPLYAVIEDMAVSPDHRSSGLGSKLVATIEADAREHGVAWLFLESGKENVGAHKFFERNGFREISHVYGKLLTGKDTDPPNA